ncbi:type VI secretion system peptidoglycan-associated domain protein [compost metagenome]|uniref:Outer membrane protein OmpA n=1 Tax=Pseudomonas jinjuensis TaxID=198616 RepID=A0A1H0M6I7_9PSED|nr:OmpA family protein [Pseudomonas jinjuensis]SDO75730.1 Outer membrane protein OmpA [Pseudomonas jinjuensis]
MNLLKTSALLLCIGLAGCSQWQNTAPDQAGQSSASKKPHWWSLGSKGGATAGESAADSQAGMAWLDQNEKPLRSAAADSGFEVERRDNALVLIVPVDTSFHPKRPEMLLSSSLAPLGRVAKLVAADPQGGVMVVGHTDSSGSEVANDRLSVERAQAVASLFRLSGLDKERVRMRGVGSDLPRADNSTSQGRALNRRVEVLWALRGVLPTLARNE